MEIGRTIGGGRQLVMVTAEERGEGCVAR